MRILFTGGGTAGHINPALAVAEYIRENIPNTKILYIGAKGGMEEKLVKDAGFDFETITITGFSRKLNLIGIKKNLITLKNIFLSMKQSRKILDKFKPDICMGTGGFVCGPILYEAYRKKIPFVIHEQNALPGITNKLLAKKAAKVMLACDAAKKYFDKSCDIVVTGNPIRVEMGKFTKEEAKKQLGLDNRPVVLSFGGSLGARKINEAVAELIKWSVQNNKYNHLHAYGKHGKWFNDLLKEKGVNPDTDGLKIQEYINDMPLRMSAADIVICRAGAITLSEIKALCKPAILIPSPNVSENHQYHNAMELVNSGAADIIEEKDLTGDVLISKTKNLLENTKKMSEFSKNLKELSIENSDKKICDIIKKIHNRQRF